MGVVKNISSHSYPKQSDSFVNKRVNVCFNYDTSHAVEGTIVRSDAEAPFRTIIKLDDGRYLLATECQYSLQ